MRYNLKNKEEINDAKRYVLKLIEEGADVEIIKKTGIRSYNQNAYLHLILGYTALEYGESLEYFKNIIWKQIINTDIFKTEYTNTKTGVTREDWRSSAELSIDEMTIAIDRLIKFAGKEMGLHLPSANKLDELRYISNQIEKNKKWL